MAKSPVLTIDEAADYLGLSVGNLNKMRMTIGGPLFIKLGRRVVYHQDDLDAWIESNRRLSTSTKAR